MAGDDLGLPDHLKVRPGNKLLWDRPTAWLLGTKLLSSLRDILLSSVYEVDPRDWMMPGKPINLSSAAQQSEDAQAPAGTWIDFFADTGDSPRLVYRLAYLLQQGSLEVLDKAGHPLQFDDGRKRPLPRGSVLIIGGDTAYPVADHQTLVERVRAPFLWAQAQLAEEGKLAAATPEVALLGIPGNHDYYNVLHGYVRTFRVPPRELLTPGVLHTEPPPRLDIPGYRTMQQASYFALLLPHQWQVWGLDVEMKQLDERQRAYFLDAPATCSRIVITSQPAMVYHAPSKRAEELAKIYAAVSLEPAFTTGGKLDKNWVQLDLAGDIHTYERYWGTDYKSDAEVQSTEVPTSIDAKKRRDSGPPRRARAQPEATVAEHCSDGERRGNETRHQTVTDERPNYASVVSGLGGAFHHPAQVRHGHAAPRRAWPPAKESARKIGELLVRPRKLFQAGAVGVVGALISGVTYWMMALVEGERAARGPQRTLNLLDIPLALPSLGPDLGNRIRNLGIMAAIIGTFVAVVGLTALGIWGMRKLGRRTLLPPLKRGPWSALSHRISHHRVAFWMLRWIGGDRRRAWRTLYSTPIWVSLLIVYLALPFALYRCPHLGRALDGFAPLYLLVVILAVAGIAVGAAVGGERHRGGSRIALGLFGLVVAALIICTWYVWTILVVQYDHRTWYVLTFFLFWPLRRLLVWSGALGGGTYTRRLVSVVGFVLLVALFFGIPRLVIDVGVRLDDFTTRPALHMAGLPVAIFFGGYFACLWVGWYLFVCLQWNAHGNEAGSAARVADYVEFLRIKLTRDTAEVWVIAADGPPRLAVPWYRRRSCKATDVDDHPISARLVDHFVVQRTPTPAPTIAASSRRSSRSWSRTPESTSGAPARKP